MWFYERIVQVPVYIIFEPSSGLLEVRRLNSEGVYEIESEDENGRYWLDGLGLYLGVWQGTRLGQNTYWLRWWDREGNLLLWGSEKIAQEKQRAEQEKQRAEQEKQRAEQEKQRAEQEKLHAEEEKQRANSAESEIAKLKAFLQKSGLEYPDS
jgi:FtsZ-interacting cell division protein YlmF